MTDQTDLKYAAQITVSLPNTGESVTLTVTLLPADVVHVDGVMKPLSECTLADLEKYRFITHLDRDVSAVLPYLNAVLNNAIYNRKGHTIVFHKEYRRISIFSNKITGAKVDDAEDAAQILIWLEHQTV